MELSFKRLGGVYHNYQCQYLVFCFFVFILQPSFPVEFTAGGFLWVSGLIIILLGGVYLIFAQVRSSLV